MSESKQQFNYYPGMPALMTSTEVAIALGVSAATIQRMIDAKELTPVDLEHEDTVFLRSEIISYVKDHYMANEEILSDNNASEITQKHPE